ncbi:MAG: polyhydroxyalkanoate depolymerase [Planctomycetes bacterium]|nr:polyhydroxyalkanoate depolymerase [Planctomycetota bacterium]
MAIRTLCAFCALVIGSPALAAEPRWWSDDVEEALKGAKDNRKELEKALVDVPKDQRKGMAFLVENMPDADLASLKAEFLLTNCDLAYKARRELPWGKDVPEELFLNDVLPYANVDEKRDAWRKEFYEMCLPMVKDCKTPTEAVQKLNKELFAKLKLGYSTQRRAPNQSPKESIEQGKASCTGLSIVLSDAARSVCIPARLVGTPLWVDKRGNHTWVEIWDKGWHFTGACEPDPNGLDRGWFVGAASQAKKDVPEHAIYATSFKKTKQHFPLVWAANNRTVPGENVTDRYARAAAPDVKAEEAKSASALKELRAALDANPAALAELVDKPFAKIPLTKADSLTARELLWKAHVARIKKDRVAEVRGWLIQDGELEMAFAYDTFGAKPKDGRSLYISLHGGGQATKGLNDSQWAKQQRLYKIEEGIYLAPRAPTNTWDLWHGPHIDRMFTRLIEDLIVFEDVNPNRVYVLGYSAGGDGVYQIAPRMADHWAAAAMMAGHPNGVSLLSLRNVPFALQVGEKDGAYNRNKVGREYGERLDKLRKDDPKGYEHFVKIHEGKGHWMNLEDKVALPWMAKFTRNPVPEKVVWKQTGTPHDRSYWLAVPAGEAKGDSLVIATRAGQLIDITTAEKVTRLLVRFDDRTADLDKPVEVKHGGKTLYAGAAPRTIATLTKTLVGRGDPALGFEAEVEVALPAAK